MRVVEGSEEFEGAEGFEGFEDFDNFLGSFICINLHTLINIRFVASWKTITDLVLGEMTLS